MRKPFAFNLSQYRITLQAADGSQDVDKRSIDFLSRELPKVPGHTLNDLYHWLNDDNRAAVQKQTGIANPQTFARHYLLALLASNKLSVKREGLPLIAGTVDATATTQGPEQSPVAQRRQRQTTPPPERPSAVSSSTVSRHEPASTPPGSQLPHVGDPIILLTGEEWLHVTDAEIPGPLPLAWIRHYRSSHRGQDLGMGAGWFTPFHTRVRAEADHWEWFDPEGRQVRFSRPQVGGRSYQTAEGLCLVEREDRLTIFGRDSQHWVFHAAPEGWRLDHSSIPSGSALHCRYDEQHRLAEVMNDQGRGFRCEYDSKGLLIRLLRIYPGTAHRRQVAQYVYDSQSDLIRADDASGRAETYHYKAHLLVRRTLRSGFSYHFEWDAQGRCLHHFGDDGHYDYRFEYAPRETRVIDALGGTRCYRFDARGHCVAYQDSLDHEIQRKYDAAGRLIEECHPSGAKARWSYDAKGRLIQRQHIDGSIERFTYNDLNHPLQHLDGAGQLWQRTYDPLGRLRTLTQPEGDTWTYHYNEQGQLQAVAGPDGDEYRYAYNAYGDLIAERSPGGALTEWLYDAEGHITAKLDAEGHLTRFQYNTAGQLITLATALVSDQLKTAWAELAHLPGARLEHFTYDAAGRLTHYTDAAGRTTQYRYGGLSQPVERIDAAGQRLQFEYDHERRLTALIDSRGKKATWDYDGNGNVIAHRDFTARTQRFSYNDDGHLIARQERHHRHTFERDSAGRLVQRTSVDTRTGDSRSVRYRYDGLGRLIEAISPGHTLRFRYNSHNQLLEEWQNGRTICHRYDVRGRRIQSSDGQLQIEYQYGAVGHLDSVRVNGVERARFTHDALGREMSRQYANGHQIESRYDQQGLLAQRLWRNTSGSDSSDDYRYDQGGRLVGISSPSQGSRHFDYDPVGRLKAAVGDWQENIERATDGTVTHMQVSRAGQPFEMAKLLSQGYGAQTLAIGTGKASPPADTDGPKEHYNDSGCLERLKTSETSLRLRYQADHQLAQAEGHNGTVHYDYDALGRRWRKQSPRGTVEFVWCGDVLWQEIHTDRQTHYVFEPGSFRPLLKIDAKRCCYYHNDHLGTPQRLTDDHGNIVWSGEYLAYGGLVLETPNGTDNPIRFPGQYHDPETGLYYNRHRYYSPLLGHYIQPDPLGLKGGLNLYQYSWNPIQHSDPLGLCNEGPAVVTSATGAMIAHEEDITGSLPALGEHVELSSLTPSPFSLNTPAPEVPYVGNASDGAKLNQRRHNTSRFPLLFDNSHGIKTWESQAGLKYGPDPAPNFSNRVQHVLNHAEDLPNRPGKHGVFNSRKEALTLTDEAWSKVLKGGAGIVHTVYPARGKVMARDVYIVPMNKRTGFIGGQWGNANGYPEASHIKLVIEEKSKIVSSFPVIP
ncbi:RHS repeat-associated core domain-containing protein [Mangrovitalea sediminis]|uniref:RHS repeat-associated core domain-containing protein n=1 Tax=Mangrovitalea sediminis TaxID=1982043 RepID=UPI0013041811|nr:RHS repeat-associated core domain-containing protein [Mangrovitalea sediminis]